jgi:predicted RNase H-like HicB family nuclease
MNLETTVHIWKEGSQYVAHALPLDVMSSGSTPDAARHALDEAIRAFLLTAADAGTLDQILARSSSRS